MIVKTIEVFERFLLRLGIASGFLTLFTMFVVVIDVAGRTFLNMPLIGGNEFAVLLLVALVFLGLAAAQQRRHNFAIDLVTRLLPPTALRFVNIVTSLISTILLGLLTWLTAELSWSMMLSGESSYGIIAFPIWPSRILITIGLGCLTLQFLFDFLRHIGLVPERAADVVDNEKVSI
ncbi:TRAP transporter small permease [uncultured Sneathiella sp.]|uniref:TRAP transporter small permease subunit n=1 Tax=uncultured Sneathiella sp. TaxID=879315 RepID=UPI0030EE7D2B|tara:strand:- start:12241 stop:12771 length:531 start_codon:yes stop_codon:yes gene_type:complete